MSAERRKTKARRVTAITLLALLAGTSPWSNRCAARPPASATPAGGDAADDEKPIPAAPLGGPMDYGPFLAYSVYRPHRPAKHAAVPAPTDLASGFPASPSLLLAGQVTTTPPLSPLPAPLPLHGRYGEEIVPKAITVTLAPDTCVCFDTELLRYHSGWTGGFLGLAATNLGAIRGTGPAPAEGVQCFSNREAPGWANPDGRGTSFADPRPAAVGGPIGPLPKTYGHYKGLYRFGQKVVFSYTIGSTDVLDSPGAVVGKGPAAFSRTIRVGPSPSPTRVAICDEADRATRADVAAADLGADGAGGLVMSVGKSATEVVAVGLPAGAGLDAEGGRVFVKLPALTNAATFKVLHASGPRAELLRPKDLLAAAGPVEDLPALCKGGPALWNEPVVVPAGAKGDDPVVLDALRRPKEQQAARLEAQSQSEFEGDPKALAAKAKELRAEAESLRNPAYVVDTINLPEANPWNCWMRPTGFDFFPDGRCAVCTLNGDVWIGTGIDAASPRVSWRRFAAGLYEPLGLKIVKDQVYVLGRDQITRLHDLNGDGEADFYENFNNDGLTCPIYHAYAMDLWTDSAGNFYYIRDGNQVPLSVPGHGCLYEVSSDGQKSQIVATGLRAANGMAVGPNDEIVCGDNQGHWIPSSKINRIGPGGFYGYVGDPRRVLPAEMDAVREREAAKHAGSYDPPLCWIPYGWDNSSGGQAWVTGDQWGPLAGRMLHTSYGKCALFEVMEEEVDGVAQGGVVQLPLKFDSGIMRARMNPSDGQLYVCGLRGWRTAAAKNGCFQRIRYTGKPITLPSELHATRGGLRITFTRPLDAASAADAGNYSVEQFVYHWSSEYGSPEFKASALDVKGHDAVSVHSAQVSADRKTIFLALDDLKPVQQMVIQMNVKAADGPPVRCSIGNTIHKLGPDRPLDSPAR